MPSCPRVRVDVVFNSGKARRYACRRRWFYGGWVLFDVFDGAPLWDREGLRICGMRNSLHLRWMSYRAGTCRLDPYELSFFWGGSAVFGLLLSALLTFLVLIVVVLVEEEKFGLRESYLSYRIVSIYVCIVRLLSLCSNTIDN